MLAVPRLAWLAVDEPPAFLDQCVVSLGSKRVDMQVASARTFAGGLAGHADRVTDRGPPHRGLMFAFGGLFAVAFAVAHGRLGALNARTTAIVVALGGYLAAFVVPFLKYPANPPSIGNADTLNERTAMYFGMALISVVLAVAATYLGRRLAPRLDTWNATLLGGLAFMIAAAVAAALLPTVDEIPQGFPAAVLWNFRIASLGIQLVMWTTMGLLFGALVQHHLEHGQAPERSTRNAANAAKAL